MPRSPRLPLCGCVSPPFASLPSQVCRQQPGSKGKYIRIILALLQSPSTAVVYECAGTLVALSNAPTAVRAAANCYCQLLVSQSDNNVKLIVLDRLQELKDKHRDVMQAREVGWDLSVASGTSRGLQGRSESEGRGCTGMRGSWGFSCPPC